MSTFATHVHHILEHDDETAVRAGAARRTLAAARIAFGLVFLWAFFDKLLGLGCATGVAQDGTVDRFGPAAWIHGGTPPQGFLGFEAEGALQGFRNNLAGTAFARWAFMLALLGIGTTWGLGRRWSQASLVQRFPELR